MKLEFEKGNAKKEFNSFWKESRWYLLILSIPAAIIIGFLFIVAFHGRTGF